jgi:hypothetical protein
MTDAKLTLPNDQWWRDHTAIIYQPMGEITHVQCEARVMRAIITDRWNRLDLKPIKTNGAVLADLKRSFMDLLEEPADDDWVPPLRPMRQDHTDYLVVMGWLTELNCSWREMTTLKRRAQSPPWSWRSIGDFIDRSPEGAKKMYLRTIHEITILANRQHSRGPERIIALRARNRAYKRRPANYD